MTEHQDAVEIARIQRETIETIAKMAHAIGWQAGVGGMETAGGIVSYLAQHPEHIGAALATACSPRACRSTGRLRDA